MPASTPRPWRLEFAYDPSRVSGIVENAAGVALPFRFSTILVFDKETAMSREQVVRDVAYAIWEAKGRPEGRDAEHWHEAEAQVAASLAGKAAQKPAQKPGAKPPAKGTPAADPDAGPAAKPPAKAAATKAAPRRKG